MTSHLKYRREYSFDEAFFFRKFYIEPKSQLPPNETVNIYTQKWVMICWQKGYWKWKSAWQLQGKYSGSHGWKGDQRRRKVTALMITLNMQGVCVDLSMDTLHLKYPLVLFEYEGSALTLPLFLLSPRIIMLCHCSSTMRKDHFLIFYGTKQVQSHPQKHLEVRRRP